MIPLSIALFTGNDSSGSEIGQRKRGVWQRVQIMSNDPRPPRETDFNRDAGARAIRAMFGQTLRQLHEVPRETPHHLLVILMQLDESRKADPPTDCEASQ